MSIVSVLVASEMTKVTSAVPAAKFEVAAAVALTVQLPAAVNVKTAVAELTVQLVVPALVTA